MDVSCTACLDSKECWPCLGKGLNPGLYGRTTCTCCHGLGICPHCLPVAIPQPRSPERRRVEVA